MQPKTIGQYLLNEALPEEMQDPSRVWYGKETSSLLSEIARKYPDKYPDVLNKLSQVAAEAQSARGGVSPSIRHMQESQSWRKQREVVKRKIQTIWHSENLSKEEKQKKTTEYLSGLSSEVTKNVFAEADSADNPFAWIIKSGMKGKPANLNNLLGSPLVFANSRNQAIPIPILRGYAKGLSPSEYWAASYGTRKGLVDVKLGTGSAGYASKQLVQIGHRGVVTDDDDPEATDDESRGFPVDVDDDDNIGTLLARKVGPYPRNTIVTARILRDLKNRGVKRMAVRSPAVGGPQDGSVYAKDVGVRENGRLMVRGENPGVLAAHALSEPLSQSALCLVAGTLVRMANGTSRPIEDIFPGDEVMGVTTDERGELITVPAKVLQLFDRGRQSCQQYIFDDGDNGHFFLDCTSDHRILMTTIDRGMWDCSRVRPIGVKAQSLFAESFDLDGRRKLRKLEKVVRLGFRDTYDLEIDLESHLYLLDSGIITHNSSKHTAGVLNAQSGGIAGFKAINQMLQVPKESVYWASHAKSDGMVQKIEKAPQGGHFVFINNEPVYVPQDVEVKVKPGDDVEAGDILSGGLPNPSAVVEHKGIGEGRRYFTQEFTKLIRDSGATVNRRNVELIAKGLVNHVELDGEMDQYVPGDKIPYSMLEKYYQARKDAYETRASAAVGQYLERPVLHYTIGTKIRPSVVQNLEEFGLADKVLVHKEPPAFRPRMVRGAAIAANDPDWLSSMQGSGIKSRTLRAAHRGDTSDIHGTSFVPGVIVNPNFGKPGSGKIVSPLYSLGEMERKRKEAPKDLFDPGG